ncbi:hypothetical protein AURDEDRAFT_163742 [Auricularia subglabra TFB-10046 SS5]|nr:hypothetical protein AURDEDRAFT_163742 [Auricularia subglabra TFB-10046 SS5]
MDRMPLELVIKFFEYLCQRDLRNTAGICRLFYRAAQDAGCSILRTINLTRAEEVERMLATFEALLEHATRKPPCDRPGFALRLVVPCLEPKDDTFKLGMNQALKALEISLPLLVELNAFVDARFLHLLYRALCLAPAPRLRTLELRQLEHRDLPAVPPPENLFKGTSPRLRTLFLTLPTLEAEWRPPAAFERVYTAHLALYQTGHRPLPISRFLPRLKSLTIDLWNNMPLVGTQPEVDLSGLDLQHLALADDSDAHCAIPGVDKVPFVEHEAEMAIANWLWPTADASSSPVSAFISPVTTWTGSSLWGGYACAFSITDGLRTRISYHLARPVQLPVVPRLEQRLTIVLLDNTLINDFFGIDAAMSALLELYVEFTRPFQLHDLRLQSVQLACPALQSVTLFTLGEWLELRSDRVATLGRMMKQEERPRESRAVLKLVKIGFLRPTPRKQLDIVFPTIQNNQKLDSTVLGLVDSSASRVEPMFFVPHSFCAHVSL